MHDTLTQADRTSTSTDHDAVAAVVRDYFEGWFEGDTQRMQRALHPALAKRSLRQVNRESPELRSVTTDQMLAWTAEGQGRRADPGGDRRIDVEVVDLYGNIASVVVRSPVYREYLHLVRADDRWRIANALWHWT
jgi:hypothetical protein